MARSLFLGATVFTLAALTGALLSGAAPAGPAPALETPARAMPAYEPLAADPADPMFARSMILSGATALAVSVAGSVIVGRRRRLW